MRSARRRLRRRRRGDRPRGDPEAARQDVNAWVADQTHDRITELMPEGSVQPPTRMVLANALSVRAPWHERFEPAEPLDFEGPAGTVRVPSMQVTSPGRGLVGQGWATARVPLAGQELALTVVRPDGTWPSCGRGCATGAWCGCCAPSPTSASC